MSTTVYHYPNCSTCRRALKWLDAQGIAAERIDIVAAPPSAALLETAWRRAGVPLKRLFNTSGRSYRGGGFKERLPDMSEAEQLAALAADGKLIRRPLVLTDDGALVGFKEAEWAALFGV